MRYQDALKGAKEFVIAQRGQVAPLSLSEEEQSPDVQDDLSHHAYALEDSGHPYPVAYEYPADAPKSEFCFFEDGRQSTIQIGHIPVELGESGETLLLIPVHFFTVAAAILHRKDRCLDVWDKAQIQQGVFVARSLVPDQEVLSRFERLGLAIHDTGSRHPGKNDYYELRRRALIESKGLRLEAEQDLISRWRNSDEAADSFLVIDGTLQNLRDEKNVDRCVGVSKSFGNRYFDISTHNRVLRLKEYERSWTFRFHDQDEGSDTTRMGVRERVSWYLRLRESPRKDPEFGLVRVEMSKRYADNAAAFADRFSRSLISDRFPTSYPRPRWDKHLYPVQACENYLSSIMPSKATVYSSMRG
jgi:hypothetical protein